MNRVYIPLLPLPVLAILASISACSKPRTEETTRVIPPAVSIAAPAAQALTLPSPAPEVLAARAEVKPADDAPSEEEVKAFERPVMK